MKALNPIPPNIPIKEDENSFNYKSKTYYDKVVIKPKE